MATQSAKRIHELTEQTDPESGDLVVVDKAANSAAKKMTLVNLVQKVLGDKYTALAAYQAALAAAEAGQVLTATGPGEASFAAPSGGGGGLPGNPTRIVLQLSQSGTSAPTVTEIVNATGLTITSSYVDVGIYFLTFSGNIFQADLGRVAIACTVGVNSVSFPGQIIDTAPYDQANVAVISQSAPGVPANGILLRSVIVIDIYP